MGPLVVAAALTLPGPVAHSPAPPPLPKVSIQDRNAFPPESYCDKRRDAWRYYRDWLIEHRLVTRGDYLIELEQQIQEAEDFCAFWDALAYARKGPWSPEYDAPRMEFVRDVLGPERYYAGWTPPGIPPPGYWGPWPSMKVEPF